MCCNPTHRDKHTVYLLPRVGVSKKIDVAFAHHSGGGRVRVTPQPHEVRLDGDIAYEEVNCHYSSRSLLGRLVGL